MLCQLGRAFRTGPKVRGLLLRIKETEIYISKKAVAGEKKAGWANAVMLQRESWQNVLVIFQRNLAELQF